MRRDVPTCRLEDALADVRERVERAGFDTCFVVTETGVVLGRLGRAVLASDDDRSVEQAMTAGPSTIRPSARLGAVVERMRKQNLTSLPVTTSDGRLAGLITRADAERALRIAEA